MTTISYPFKRIRLSHSTLELLDTCEREFQIERFFQGTKDEEVTDNPNFIFGRSFGNAFQEYLLTGSLDKALWRAFLSYTPWVEQDSKTFWKVCNGLIKNADKIDKFLSENRLAYFNRKPAVELGINVNIDETFYYVGFIDAVIQNNVTGRYGIVEAKTTALALYEIEPLYRHSGQGIGYSIGLDSIVGEELSDYDIIYPVLQYPNRLAADPVLHFLRFPKTLLDRLQWFMTLQMDVEKIKTMFLLNHFPKRVKSCIRYNKVCPQYGSCHLLSIEDYRKELPDPHEDKYSFRFELGAIIEDHLKRVSQNTTLLKEVQGVVS